MTNRMTLYALLFISALTGVFGGQFMARHVSAGLMWKFALEFMFSVAAFLWYCRDSDVRHFRRSSWLSVAMVGVAFLAVPYYLWRSRPTGERGRAILRFLGFVLLLLGVSVAGLAIGELLV